MSIKKDGKWGINPAVSIACPRCGVILPKIRKPKYLRQALWGGGTCENCGCEVDKWGKEITKQRKRNDGSPIKSPPSRE